MNVSLILDASPKLQEVRISALLHEAKSRVELDHLVFAVEGDFVAAQELSQLDESDDEPEKQIALIFLPE